MSKKDKNQFKDTLNLPKTSFPMKANLAQNEPQTLKKWTQENLYQQLLDAKENSTESFLFHDGPPYANGDIHIGHLLNKVLKDIVVRSQHKMGKQCSFTPGWDCHGLPIEHRVMTGLSEEKRQKLDGLDEDTRRIAIRRDCKNYAEKFIKLQSGQMQRLLTVGDYKSPYLTMNPQFESRVINLFADLVKEGVVYRQLKPVHWSIANQTALAEAELEYYDKTDTSVFVKFNLNNPSSLDSELTETSLLSWTTTPWTLPANLAVAIHEDYDYQLVKWQNHEPVIIAKDLKETIENTCSLAEGQVIKTIKGSELINQTYTHPFCEREGTVTHAAYVTLEDGTGLVHIAPGHGVDDYNVGQTLGLETYCPVQGDGCYDTSVPDWLIGKSIWAANDTIVSKLKESNHMLYDYEFDHSYPHDWRSKTPVIFRSTEQWFISVDNAMKSNHKNIREMALSSVSKSIKFTPEWGQNRLHGMLESRPDWCISRQRSWGLPIPAFQDANGTIILTEATTRAIAKVFETEGSDAWFKKSPSELLTHYDSSTDTELNEPIDLNKLTKLYDIFDVWFESGSSWEAVMHGKETGKQVDLYLEGSDQHRGWFHLSLLLGLGTQQKPPFKRILTHGFIVDKDGRKMSKSLGNTINVDTLLSKYGAEVARWWVSSLAYENDIKVDLSFFDIAGDSYRKIRNTIRFLLSNIDDLESKPLLTNELRQSFIDQLNNKTPEAYILDKLSDCVHECKEHYTSYDFKALHSKLYNFCNTELSSFYCMMTKDRLYCDSKNSERRLRAQHTMHIITDTLCHLLAPILPHTAQEIFSSLYKDQHPLDCHTLNFPEFTSTASNKWEAIMSLRTIAQKALEEAKETGLDNALDAKIICPNKNLQFSDFENELDDIFGVSQVELDESITEIKVINIQDHPRCERSWKRDKTVKEREDGSLLSDRDAIAVESVRSIN